MKLLTTITIVLTISSVLKARDYHHDNNIYSNSLSYDDYIYNDDYDNSEDLSVEVTPYCPFGILVNNKCQCSVLCPAIYEPVCGSDGKTYSSNCHLQGAACDSHTFISVKYKGVCNDITKPPKTTCAYIDCRGTCIETENGPKCVDEPIKPYHSTCASTTCHIGAKCVETPKGAKCVKLNRCADLRCGYGSACVEYYNGAKCVKKHCPTACTLDIRPVCGTDGKTYENECQLRVASCDSIIPIQVKYEGQCLQISGHYCNKQNLYCRRRLRKIPRRKKLLKHLKFLKHLKHLKRSKYLRRLKHHKH